MYSPRISTILLKQGEVIVPTGTQWVNMNPDCDSLTIVRTGFSDVPAGHEHCLELPSILRRRMVWWREQVRGIVLCQSTPAADALQRVLIQLQGVDGSNSSSETCDRRGKDRYIPRRVRGVVISEDAVAAAAGPFVFRPPPHARPFRVERGGVRGRCHNRAGSRRNGERVRKRRRPWRMAKSAGARSRRLSDECPAGRRVRIECQRRRRWLGHNMSLRAVVRAGIQLRPVPTRHIARVAFHAARLLHSSGSAQGTSHPWCPYPPI